LLLYSPHPGSLGVPNWPVIYIINTEPPTSFLAPLSGIQEEEAPTSTTRSHVNLAPAKVFWHHCRGKRRLMQGEFHTHILYFVLVLLYFIFACIILSKTHTKLVSFIVVYYV
jgi:hypothetical protein